MLTPCHNIAPQPFPNAMNAERRYLSAACLRRTAWGLLCGMLLAGCIRGEEQAGPEESSLVRTGEAAPDFTAAMTDGSSQRLSDLRGKVVLLTFWCTWCPTCQEEMAAVGKEAVERFADRPFVFLPVSRGESLEEVRGYLAREGLGFPSGIDPEGAIYGLYATLYVPRNYVIGPDGKVVHQNADYTPQDFAQVVAAIEAALSDVSGPDSAGE